VNDAFTKTALARPACGCRNITATVYGKGLQTLNCWIKSNEGIGKRMPVNS
jgi:hypothetical protein